MIRLMICVLCLLFSLSLFAAEEEELTSTYKCYIETNYGNDIAMFTWLPSKQVESQASILTQKVSTASGKRAVVRGVEQCVLTSVDFKSKSAQKLDEEISTY
ncbi:TapY2 family type IVa secretion system protein [Shewanella goraebulensis]|uniref:TapY2 family type IVa secretion system protein n=1 Tax=Shewanella goraebulensis TaxID=3050637 RepID=UPI002549F39E|nr:TapY2 family type IVa secretion system protein [Shewanella goraebulensis]